MQIEVGLMPYLNSALFYLSMRDGTVALRPMVPTTMAKAARDGMIDAGPVPLVECFRLEDSFEPLGDFCIASRKRARSILLFSKVPVEELHGKAIGVTGESSTSARLLRVLLHHRYQVRPPQYVGLSAPHDAFLLIGDGALKQRRGAPGYGHCYDLGEVWHQWTGLPFVFALWIVRRMLPHQAKTTLAKAIARGLDEGFSCLPEIVARHDDLGMSEEEVSEYLRGFSFTVGAPERQAIQRFRSLLELPDETEVSSHASNR